MSYMGKAYEEVQQFNEIIGNLNQYSNVELYTRIKNALVLISEELNETYEAQNNVDLLDGAIDLYVVVTGFMQLLSANGFDIEGAVKATNENNFSKFCTNEQQVRSTFDKYEKLGIQCSLSFHDKTGLFAVKNKKTGKLLKPANFVSNDLSGYSPKELKF